MNGTVKYLSHADFVKVKQWTLLETVEGKYFDQIKNYDESISASKDACGEIPFYLIAQKRKFISEWALPCLNSRFVCVDVTTGEVYIPN